MHIPCFEKNLHVNATLRCMGHYALPVTPACFFNNRGVLHSHEVIKVQICLAWYWKMLLCQGDHQCMDCLGVRPTGTQAQWGGYTFNFPDQALLVTVID